jgi:hypothetical protein
MYQRNVRFEVLSAECEDYCLQGIREDAGSTCKLTEYMASHGKSVHSKTFGSAICDQWRYNNKSSKHVESTHAPSPDLSSRSTGSSSVGHHLEDHFSLLQDKLHKTDSYDKLWWCLELHNYGNLPSAGFEWELKCSCNWSCVFQTFPRWPHNYKLQCEIQWL